jgi:hypothetical protein
VAAPLSHTSAKAYHQPAATNQRRVEKARNEMPNHPQQQPSQIVGDHLSALPINQPMSQLYDQANSM